MTIRPLRSSIIVSYKIQARFETKINWAKVQKSILFAKFAQVIFEAQKTTFYRQKHLCGMKVFRVIFLRIKPNAHTPRSMQGKDYI